MGEMNFCIDKYYVVCDTGPGGLRIARPSYSSFELSTGIDDHININLTVPYFEFKPIKEQNIINITEEDIMATFEE